MAANTPFELPESARKELVHYARRAQELMHNQYSIRNGLQTVDLYYQMEGNLGQENSDARRANRNGDKSRFRDIVVPVVMPQVESALGYYMSVFLSGNPIFAVGGPVEYEEAALQINSLLAKQSKKAKWARELVMFWRDGLKYNLQGIEVDWQQKTSFSLDTVEGQLNGQPKEIIWSGNVLKRMDLYNTFLDPRVAPAEVHEYGEFAGYNQLFSRIRMKKFVNELFGKIPPSIAIAALESGYTGVASSSGSLNYYVPQINPDALRAAQNGQFDWTAWMTASAPNGASIAYKNMYLVTKIYARIIPSDFNLRVPAANTPQVWKLYIVNNDVLLYAERLTNAHNFIPILFGQPIEDGLNYQTKSFASNVTGMQDTSSAFWNAAMNSKRRLVTDRMFYDPSRIREKDINNPNPTSKIPVRPSMYGKTLSEAVYQVPFRDELSGSLVQESNMLVSFANLINGQNAATQGQFTKGNRTLHEYQDIVGHSNSRNQTLAKMTEEQVHAPMKEMLLLNILQFQTAGTIVSADNKQEVEVDPVALRTAVMEFEISDGMTPLDKDMNTDELISAFQVLGSTPALQQGYEMAPMFSYLMKLRGADLTPFEKSPAEMQYDQQMAQWQQAAALAAQKGAAFSTPMPQPPDQQQIQQEKLQRKQQASQSVAQMVASLGEAPKGNPQQPSPQQLAAQQSQQGAQ